MAGCQITGFLTTKPMIFVVNIDEDQLREGSFEGEDSITAYAQEKGIPVLAICLELEAEIARLEPEERELFLEEMGIAEPGIERGRQGYLQAPGLDFISNCR
ncbi:MAG: hypothetical protein RQM95_02345 [Syntrophaceticus schinkii]